MSKYIQIKEHYERCFDKHGDTHKGMDWPNEKDVENRFSIMLDLIRSEDKIDETTLLDLGCGTAHLLEYIRRKNHNNIKYSGLDISERFIEVARNKHPNNTFYALDLLKDEFEVMFDYIVMNGVFTEKRNLEEVEMWEFFENLLKRAFLISKRGIAFNVMSKNVDWEREDLFHVSLDKLSNFLCKNLSRDFVIRNDYGLYEFTTYVYK